MVLILGIRSKMCDDEGRFRADPLSLYISLLAADPTCNAEITEEALHDLEALRLIHLYEANGAKYGKIHDFHDWQKPEAPTRSHMPPPPPDLCECASDTWFVGEKSPNTRRRVGVGREGKGKERKDKKDTPPAPPPVCSWCTKPLPENASTVQVLVKYYHDAFLDVRKRCPAGNLARPGHAMNALKKLLEAGDPVDRIKAIIDAGLLSGNQVIVDCGYSLEKILYFAEGIKDAIEHGEQHGSKPFLDRTRGAQPARVHTATAGSNKRSTGEVSL